uniref:Defensin n=1 Tax=Fredericella sultana TaxID=349672 RepID=I4E999_9BILA|nr:defensin [Fredericella sultana]
MASSKAIICVLFLLVAVAFAEEDEVAEESEVADADEAENAEDMDEDVMDDKRKHLFCKGVCVRSSKYCKFGTITNGSCFKGTKCCVFFRG